MFPSSSLFRALQLSRPAWLEFAPTSAKGHDRRGARLHGEVTDSIHSADLPEPDGDLDDPGCPRCGSDMLLSRSRRRNGKDGRVFWRCVHAGAPDSCKGALSL